MDSQARQAVSISGSVVCDGITIYNAVWVKVFSEMRVDSTVWVEGAYYNGHISLWDCMVKWTEGLGQNIRNAE